MFEVQVTASYVSRRKKKKKKTPLPDIVIPPVQFAEVKRFPGQNLPNFSLQVADPESDKRAEKRD